MRVYAIGDVHGRLDLLDRLLDAIANDDATRESTEVRLIFLGDLIDRGPQSREVIDRVLALKDNDIDVAVLRGNHEEVFQLVLDGDEEALRFFNRIGGRETILSYGIDAEFFACAELPELQAALIENVPARHIQLLRECEDMVEIGDYLFVHAGIRPGTALDQQRTADLRWIRGGFLDFEGSHPRMIVHGHTPSAEIEWRSNRIGVDTGAYESGVLSAIGIEGAERWALSTALETV
ncbi:metallophosphoesterase family protein [Sphingomonas gilva]|nr:metallophosphoesterase family protein [Sphingomonas gilva]